MNGAEMDVLQLLLLLFLVRNALLCFGTWYNCAPSHLFFAFVRPSTQPLERAEFRLKVSKSVDPPAMYAKTLEATKVSLLFSTLI